MNDYKLRFRFPAGACAVLVVMLAALVCRTAAGAYVELPDGSRVEGSRIRARSDGEIVLTTPQGIRTFPPGRYVRAVAERPQEFDQARRLAGQRQFDEAIQMLQQIIRDYRHLDWDLRAMELLARIHDVREEYSEAVSVYERLFRQDEDRRGELQWPYFQTLLKAEEYDTLRRRVDEVISEGSRADAARAQNVRGDLLRAQQRIRPAALDYLRTVILFPRVEEGVRAAAMFKAAEMLEQLRDRRAEELYRRLVEEYPGSDYAEEARAKL